MASPITLDPATLRWCAEELEHKRDCIERGDGPGNLGRHWLEQRARSFRATAASIDLRRGRAAGVVKFDTIRGRTPDEIRGLLGEFSEELSGYVGALREDGGECTCCPNDECPLCKGTRLISQAAEILK